MLFLSFSLISQIFSEVLPDKPGNSFVFAVSGVLRWGDTQNCTILFSCFPCRDGNLKLFTFIVTAFNNFLSI